MPEKIKIGEPNPKSVTQIIEKNKKVECIDKNISAYVVA